jgi:hypothetical protein
MGNARQNGFHHVVPPIICSATPEHHRGTRGVLVVVVADNELKSHPKFSSENTNISQ